MIKTVAHLLGTFILLCIKAWIPVINRKSSLKDQGLECRVQRDHGAYFGHVIYLFIYYFSPIGLLNRNFYKVKDVVTLIFSDIYQHCCLDR